MSPLVGEYLASISCRPGQCHACVLDDCGCEYEGQEVSALGCPVGKHGAEMVTQRTMSDRELIFF